MAATAQASGSAMNAENGTIARLLTFWESACLTPMPNGSLEVGERTRGRRPHAPRRCEGSYRCATRPELSCRENSGEDLNGWARAAASPPDLAEIGGPRR
jgi:hypothetical protein